MAPLPESGPERAIFIRSLRAFSDNCSPPTLTPTCPFYRNDHTGAWCLEECMDLLATHAGDADDGVPLGFALMAHRRRPRARRSSSAVAKPFDAREIWAEDRVHPVRLWRPSSLLHHAVDTLINPSELSLDGQVEKMGHLLETLGDRG